MSNVCGLFVRQIPIHDVFAYHIEHRHGNFVDLLGSAVPIMIDQITSIQFGDFPAMFEYQNYLVGGLERFLFFHSVGNSDPD